MEPRTRRSPQRRGDLGENLRLTAVVEFRSDLRPILDNLAYSSADDSSKTLAVLMLVLESSTFAVGNGD
jgi:hypothetical protein